MTLVRLIALPLIFLSAFAAWAQETPTEAAPRYPLQIVGVTPTVTDNGVTLTVQGANLNGCGDPQTEILQNADGVVVIDVYNTETDCAEAAAEHTVEIPVEATFPSLGLTVDLNGVPYLINPDGTFGPAFIAPINITAITPVVEENTLKIAITGETDGCDVPVITRYVVENGAINVRLYKVLSAAMTCPMMLVEYTTELEIPLNGSESGLWLIEANGFEIGYEIVQGMVFASADLMRVDATITSIEVSQGAPLPQQVILTLQGSHPDGCAVPTQVRQQFDVPSNTLTVRVYRVLSPAMTCLAEPTEFTLTVPLEYAVSPGMSFTIEANGTTAEVTF